VEQPPACESLLRPNPKTRRGIGGGPEEAAEAAASELHLGADQSLLAARLFFLVVKEPGLK